MFLLTLDICSCFVELVVLDPLFVFLITQCRKL